MLERVYFCLLFHSSIFPEHQNKKDDTIELLKIKILEKIGDRRKVISKVGTRQNCVPEIRTQTNGYLKIGVQPQLHNSKH